MGDNYNCGSKDHHISFLWLPQQITTHLVAKTTEMYSVTFLEARSSKSRCQHGHAPLKALAGKSLLLTSFP